MKHLRYAHPLELFGRAMAMSTRAQPDYMPPVNKTSGLDMGGQGMQAFTYRDYKNMREEAFAPA